MSTKLEDSFENHTLDSAMSFMDGPRPGKEGVLSSLSNVENKSCILILCSLMSKKERVELIVSNKRPFAKQ